MPTKSKKPATPRPARPTEGNIKFWSGSGSFERGSEYYHGDMVYDCRRNGDELQAKCRGQSANFYHVDLTVTGKKIVSGNCTCPVGAGGHCKHAVAVLLTWLHRPESFTEAAVLRELLGGLSKEQLIGLLQQVVDREPDLEAWLEVQATLQNSQSTGTVKPELIQRQIAMAFDHPEYYWGIEREISRDLEPVYQQGVTLRQQHNPQAAVLVFSTMIPEILESRRWLEDENWDIMRIVIDSAEELGEIFGTLPVADPLRKTILQALYTILQESTRGGYDGAEPVYKVVYDETTAPEKALLVQWIEKDLRDKQLDKYSRQEYGRLRQSLQAEAPLDEAAWLKQCRETGLTDEIIQHFLQHQRFTEAVQEMRALEDYQLVKYLTRLVELGEAELADQTAGELVRKQKQPSWQLQNWLISRQLTKGEYAAARQQFRKLAPNTVTGFLNQLVDLKQRELAEQTALELLDEKNQYGGPAYRQWLLNAYTSTRRWELALDFLRDEFREKPSLKSYQELREIGQKLKNWNELREELLEEVRANLPAAEQIRIHLLENELSDAIQTVEAVESKAGQRPAGWAELKVQVAHAAEKEFPLTAAAFYLPEVELYVSRKNRNSYKSAILVLKTIRKLYEKAGQRAEFATLIQSLRDKHPNLRAFQQELDLAKM